ncbi:MAG: hypothetical protein LC777_10365, partial [Actinobacteria bacterium]|nr:hypothetical protein [Actinomycetota bacterium]
VLAPTAAPDLLPYVPSLMPAIAIAPDRPLAAHHPLGASTGYFERWRGNWDELLSRVVAVSSFAAEFAALSEPEFGGLLNFLSQRPRLPFVYLSVHAPVKARVATEETLAEWLRSLPPNVESIVTHPDTFTDVDLFGQIGRRLVVENMDDRKSSGRTVQELTKVFAALPRAGFCFDIAHAWSIDPTMRLAHDLLDHFGDRLRQLHLSSLAGGKHVPVLPEHEEVFAPLLRRCSDVPWILEAEMPERWQPSSWVQHAVMADGERALA